jgi:hypothetical protein
MSLFWLNPTVHLSMPDYVECAFAQLGYPIPRTPQHQLHQHAIPTCGATVQYETRRHIRKLLTSREIFTQEVIGVFLYYGRAVHPTMLTALSTIASAQAKPTEDTMMRCKQFLDYAATHQDAIITYKKSDMVLVVHSDASYPSEPYARSRAGNISSCHPALMIQSTMWKFSTLHKSSRRLCPMLQRPI